MINYVQMVYSTNNLLGGLRPLSTPKANSWGEVFPHTYKLTTQSLPQPMWDNSNTITNKAMMREIKERRKIAITKEGKNLPCLGKSNCEMISSIHFE
jgi:hypothetical protein